MTRTVELGAPSLTGKDANNLVDDVFSDAAYPLKVVVKNHMPQDVVFPEIDGLFLRHVANAKDSQKVVVIPDADAFQRLASSIEQIAELNHCALALTISEVVEAVAKKPSDGMSYEQIKEALKVKGIEFPFGAKKAELAALLDASEKSVSGV